MESYVRKPLSTYLCVLNRSCLNVFVRYSCHTQSFVRIWIIRIWRKRCTYENCQAVLTTNDHNNIFRKLQQHGQWRQQQQQIPRKAISSSTHDIDTTWTKTWNLYDIQCRRHGSISDRCTANSMVDQMGIQANFGLNGAESKAGSGIAHSMRNQFVKIYIFKNRVITHAWGNFKF